MPIPCEMGKSAKWVSKYRVWHTKITERSSRIQIWKNYFDNLNYIKLFYFCIPSEFPDATCLEIWRMAPRCLDLAPRCLDFPSGTDRSYIFWTLDGATVQWHKDTLKHFDLSLYYHLVILEPISTWIKVRIDTFYIFFHRFRGVYKLQYGNMRRQLKSYKSDISMS